MSRIRLTERGKEVARTIELDDDLKHLPIYFKKVFDFQKEKKREPNDIEIDKMWNDSLGIIAKEKFSKLIQKLNEKEVKGE